VSAIRYLLDEHVDAALRAQLVWHEPDLVVWIIGDPGAPRRGCPDADILLLSSIFPFPLLPRSSAPCPSAPPLLCSRPVVTRKETIKSNVRFSMEDGRWKTENGRRKMEDGR